MRVLARGIEDARNLAIERPEGRDPRELDGATIFSRASFCSAAVRTAGILRSDAGMVFTRCAIASRRDASLAPPGSTTGSAKRPSQDTTQLRNRTGFKPSPADSFRPLPNRTGRVAGPFRTSNPSALSALARPL